MREVDSTNLQSEGGTLLERSGGGGNGHRVVSSRCGITVIADVAGPYGGSARKTGFSQVEISAVVVVIVAIAVLDLISDTRINHNARRHGMEGKAPNGEQALNRSALVVVVVLCLGLGGLMTGNFCFEIHKQIQRRTILRHEGRETVGSVTATHTGHGSPTVTYVFKANGLKYSGKAEILNYRLVLHESDPIAIRYIPTDPTVNHPADWEWSSQGDLVPEVFILLFTSVGVMALVALFRNRRSARHEG